MLHALADAGADVIELGVPFSDPMADGAAIQRASEAALANGMTLADILRQVGEFRRENKKTPLVLMGYANSFINYGKQGKHGKQGEDFPAAAAAAGVNGLIIVDMADADRAAWRDRMAAVGMDLIALIAPTTAAARRDKIIAEAQGFLYFISVRGVTGAQHLQAEQIAAQVQAIRAAARVPLAVGFGVRSEAQACEVAAIADAVVVGSRLIEIAEAEAEAANAPAAVGAFLHSMAEALR